MTHSECRLGKGFGTDRRSGKIWKKDLKEIINSFNGFMELLTFPYTI
jgi:hypothetical protein